MKLSAFLRDKVLLLLLHFVCMAALSAFLSATGYPASYIALICLFWLLILLTWLLSAFLRRRRYFKEAARTLENLDKGYLLGEMMPDSPLLEDRLYREMLRRSNRSVIEKIRLLEEDQRQYREYLETWVHEIKSPITGIALLCENGRQKITPAINETLRAVLLENRKIENAVDTVLYLARSEEVYRDYLIRKVCLEEVVQEALGRERLLLIENRVRAEVSCGESVYTDPKWLAFILGQLLLNSIKYRSETPLFRFSVQDEASQTILAFEDNGRGIRPEDLPRIFDKGFTGNNGRDQDKATGIGLYLCKKLCEKLDISLTARSVYGEGTTMLLAFPKNSYLLRNDGQFPADEYPADSPAESYKNVR